MNPDGSNHIEVIEGSLDSIEKEGPKKPDDINTKLDNINRRIYKLELRISELESSLSDRIQLQVKQVLKSLGIYDKDKNK